MGTNRFIARFAGTCGSAAVPATLGLACILVWNQCVLYGQRISVDGGATTIATTLVRCLTIVLLLALALRSAWHGKVPRWWELTSVALMSLSGLIELVGGILGGPVLFWLGLVFSAVGITWGGGMWIQSCARYPLRDVFAIATVAMGLSALVGIVVCYLPTSLCASLGIFLPIVSYACYRRSFDDDRIVPEREKEGPSGMPAISGEARSVFVSIAAFSIVLGICRGYPDGSSLVIPYVLLPMQFAVVIVVVLYALAMLSDPRFKPKAGPIWACYIGMLAIGVFLVFSMDNRFVGWGATLISAINLLQVLMLWMLACDIAREDKETPYVGLAILWLIHLFFRELGRACIFLAPAATEAAQTMYLAVAVCLLALAVALLFAGRTSAGRALFTDYAYCGPAGTCGSDVEARTGRVPAEIRVPSDAAASNSALTSVLSGASLDVHAGEENVVGGVGGRFSAVAQGVPVPAPAPGSAPSASVTAPFGSASALAVAVQSVSLDWLKDQYGLTPRECEIAEQLAFNRSAATIAERLSLSKETVRSYTKTVYAKTDVHSRAELAALFERHGDPRMSF